MMRYRKHTVDRRGNRYIESEKGQTRTYQAREVRNQASPDHSRETDETSGVDLMQEERRSNSVWSGMGVNVGNQLDAKKREGRRSVRSGMHQQDTRGLEGLGVHY